MGLSKKTKLIVSLALTISLTSVLTIGCNNGVSQSNNNKTQEASNDSTLIYTQGIEQTTIYGKVKGSKENNEKTLLWQGIPYAKAPIGNLRWKAPEDPEIWNNVFDATTPGNVGIQLSGSDIIGSEDCLNLDIYRPNTDETNLPVLLFIHGGNNQTGTSSEIDARKLAVNANCIVVSINYRLGALGFNSLPALKTGDINEDSGNYTLLDIAKSLDWINENIEAFGGNPNNITASGFSAGNRDIMAMLISPIFEGKFQKAIAFSGGMTISDPEESAQIIAKAIAPLVIEDNVKETEEDAYNWLLTDDTEVKDYLYSLSAERLSALMGNASIRMSVFPHLYTDGVVLPKEGFETTKYNAVPLIMVTGANEFSLFGRYDKYFAKYDDETILNDENLSNQLDFTLKYGSKLYEIFNAEESAIKMFDNYSSPIYTCDFKWGNNSDVVGEEMAKFVGAYHGVFLPFLTDTVTGFGASYPEAFNNEGAKDLSNKFTKYISNFLWNDNPNGEDLVEWNSWTSSSDGPTQLLLDADLNKAIITISHERTSYESILNEIENNHSITDEDKNTIVKEVLNGRWFSSRLDSYFNN